MERWSSSQYSNDHGANKSDAAEVIKWANQMLSTKGHTGHVVTDLSSDIADGITLLKLVEAVANERLPDHSSAPIMRAKKLENFQICLDTLQQWHVPVNNVQADDLLAGNVEVILTLCNTLKKYFTSLNRGNRIHVYSTINKEDIEVFSWVGRLLRRDIKSYSMFHDGKILCQLINILHEGAISNEELETTKDALSRLTLAEVAAKEYLFISPSFNAVQVSNGEEDRRLCTFIQQCKTLYQQQTRGRGMVPKSSKVRSASCERMEGVSSVGGAREVDARSYDVIHKRKSEHSYRKIHSDLYIQGASSFTDLTSRRAEHRSMIQGGGGAGVKLSVKTSSSENLDQNSRFGSGGLDRVQSMESGISSQQRESSQSGAESNTLPRSSSQGTLQHIPHHHPPHPSTITKSLNKSTESFSSEHKIPSYLQLSSVSSDDLPYHLSALEERVGVLATQFLYERQDMFKQIMRTLVKERKKRQLAEHRLEVLECASKNLVKHYDSRLIDLAKELAILRSEIALQKGGAVSSSINMELEQLKDQLSTLTATTAKVPHEHDLHFPSSSPHVLFLRKRKVEPSGDRGSSDGGVHLLESYSQGSAASYKKLSRFFGEEPPRVESLESLLENLGYVHLLAKLRAHNITLAELVTLSESHLEAIGVPLGQRVRLLEEAKKLEPVEYGSHIRHIKSC